jgi:hypothetical protein
MARDRTELRKPTAVVRRTAVAATILRSASVAALVSPVQALQRRLGNQGTQALISRSIAGPAQVSTASPVAAQFARVSQPNDPAGGPITQARPTAAMPMTSAGDAGLHPAAAAAPGAAASPDAANARAAATPAAEHGAVGSAAKGQAPAGGDKSVVPGAGGTAQKAAAKAAPEAGEKADAAGASAGPAQDAGFQRVVGKVRTTAAKQRAHTPAGVKAAQAQAAAVGPSGEVASRAQDRHVQEMDSKQPRPFNRAAFKAALLAKIKDTAPKNLEEADNFKASGKVAGVKADLQGTVQAGKKDAAGPVADTASKPADASGIAPKPVTPMPPVEAAPPAGDVDAGAATPKPRSDAEISLQAGPQQIEQQMASADVTDEQLKNSNEPAFQGAVVAKENAQKQSDAAPQAFRAGERADLGAARADATMAAHRELGAMHGARGKMMMAAFGHQTEAKAKDEQRRAEVASHIQGIYDKAKAAVEVRLKKLDDDVVKTFDQGAAAAQKTFEDYVDHRMLLYKAHRYSDALGLFRWGKDKLFGMPDEVNAFYVEGRDLYVAQMDHVLDDVTTTVETGLNEAKDGIAKARQEITVYVAGLEPSLRDVGKQAAQEIGGKLDQLEQSVNEKQDQLIDTLAQKYNESMQQVDERITAMKASNRGLIDALKDAVAGVIQTIMKLKNMLAGVLSRAANAVGLIIKDPIGFLGNMVGAVKLGVQNFSSRIEQHMKQGFMDWLFGAVAETGIQLPKTFDFSGILSLVLQVLGLTYANFRARAVALLGENMVAAIETTVDIIKKAVTEGPGALWEWIKEKVGDLKAMVIDQLRNFIIERVINAGITWLIGLLNPVSAFIKACKAIYDLIMFFVERAAQIVALLNAIIDSITAIATGSLGAAASKVEMALAKGIPVVIGLLASLLGISGVSEKIKSVIEAIRKPINTAIDWVIHKAATMVKAAGKAIGGLLGGKKDKEKKDDKPDERTPAQKQADLDKGLSEAEALLKEQHAPASKLQAKLAPIKTKYKMVRLEFSVVDKNNADGLETVETIGEINPKSSKKDIHTLKQLVTSINPINSAYRGHVVTIISGPLKGISVTYNALGFPDFAPFSIAIVKIEMRGNRLYRVPDGDFGNANEKAGYDRNKGEPDEYTWHHHEDRQTMMLVKTEIHDAFRHSGGVWVIDQLGEK